MHPIELLRSEHVLIEKVLDSLEHAVRDDAPLEHQTVSRYAAFFREFADRCHHGKEEEMLFVELARHGMPVEGGPLGCMRHEHDSGRALVRELARLGDGDGPLGADERRQVASVAGQFIELLRAHIQKENQVLFPMAMRLLPTPKMKELGQRFATFQSDTIGDEEYGRLQERAQGFPSPA